MIDFAGIKKTVNEVFTEIGGVPVKWADESQGSAWMGAPTLLCRIKDIDSIGIEEERRQDVVHEDSQINVTGQRKFTLSLRSESFNANIDRWDFAANIIERVKIRIARQSVIERLTPAFAISDYVSTKYFTYKDQGREISAYILDLLCLTVDNDIDDSSGAGGWIGEAQIAGTIKDTSNNVLNTVNLDVKAD